MQITDILIIFHKRYSMSKRKPSPLSEPSSPKKKIKLNLSKTIFLSNHKASPPQNISSNESEPDYQQIIEVAYF